MEGWGSLSRYPSDTRAETSRVASSTLKPACQAASSRVPPRARARRRRARARSRGLDFKPHHTPRGDP